MYEGSCGPSRQLALTEADDSEFSSECVGSSVDLTGQKVFKELKSLSALPSYETGQRCTKCPCRVPEVHVTLRLLPSKAYNRLSLNP